MLVESEEGMITSLKFEGVNEIYPWGIEFADSSSFYSIENGVGLRYEEKINDDYSSRLIELTEGKFDLKTNNIISKNRIIREQEIVTLETSYLMDYVMRFRFRKESIKKVMISDRVIVHEGSNVYYQFEVDSLTILFTNGKKALIKLIDVCIPDGMKQVMYVRDQKNEWVIHIRFIPIRYDKSVIKVCTSWAGTRPLPTLLSGRILSIPCIRNYLWYKAELRPYKSKLIRYLLNLSACPMVMVPIGQKLRIKASFELTSCLIE